MILKRIFNLFIWIVLLPYKLVKLLFKRQYDFLKEREFNKVCNLGLEAIDSLSGVEFEHFIATLLELFEIKCVKTRQSGDFGADIIASYKGISLVIQAKLFYTKSVGNSAIQEGFSACSFYDANLAMVMTNSSFSKSAEQTANKLGVLLFSRKEWNYLFALDYKLAKKWILNFIFGEFF